MADTAEAVIAAAMCPPHHRHGSAWSLRDADGLVSVGTSVLTPCAEHVGAARVALAALHRARYVVLYMPPDDPNDQPPSDLFEYDEDAVVMPSRTDRQPPNTATNAKGGYSPVGADETKRSDLVTPSDTLSKDRGGTDG